MPFFSIITPTIQRQTLLRCCDSVNEQTMTDWQHIVMVDQEIMDEDLLNKVKHPQRIIIQCEHPHRNYGNTCRHHAWDYASGRFLIHLDDDNFLSLPDTLKSISKVLERDDPEWALFPILRHGSIFFNDPPGLCMSDTANVVVRREIGQWPDGPEYTMDGIWIESLKSKYPYLAYPAFCPIVVMPTSGEGR
jgi:glycosyltransferase involved in cell wall biosynthesis